MTTYDSGQPALLAKAFGQGCVLLSGDSSHIHDQGVIGDVDNLLFGLNAFLFLNECFPSDFVGGELIPLDTTALLLAGAQMNAAWMVPIIVSAAGIGLLIQAQKTKLKHNSCPSCKLDSDDIFKLGDKTVGECDNPKCRVSLFFIK